MRALPLLLLLLAEVGLAATLAAAVLDAGRPPPAPEGAAATAATPGGDGAGAPVMGLVPAPGRDQVLAHCVACHSTALITQNRMTRGRWAETITWMQETQGLWTIPDPDRAKILDYLEATQGVGLSGGLPGGAESPWATPTYRPNPLW